MVGRRRLLEFLIVGGFLASFQFVVQLFRRASALNRTSNANEKSSSFCGLLFFILKFLFN